MSRFRFWCSILFRIKNYSRTFFSALLNKKSIWYLIAMIIRFNCRHGSDHHFEHHIGKRYYIELQQSFVSIIVMEAIIALSILKDTMRFDHTITTISTSLFYYQSFIDLNIQQPIGNSYLLTEVISYLLPELFSKISTFNQTRKQALV